MSSESKTIDAAIDVWRIGINYPGILDEASPYHAASRYLCRLFDDVASVEDELSEVERPYEPCHIDTFVDSLKSMTGFERIKAIEWILSEPPETETRYYKLSNMSVEVALEPYEWEEVRQEVRRRWPNLIPSGDG